jgi:diguanylate cyclase (GGDEF)-like protein
VNNKEAKYTINPFLAEFDDQRMERAYRIWKFVDQIEDATSALLIASFFYILFSVIDYVRGLDLIRILVLTGIRLTIVATVLYVVFVHWKKYARPSRFYPTISMLLVSLVVAILFAGLYARNRIFPASLSGMIVIMAIYLFIPNRYIYSVIIGVLSTISFILIYASSDDASAYAILLIASIFGALNVFCATFLNNLNVSRRNEFSLLMHESELRKRLDEEIIRRITLEKELRLLATVDTLTGGFTRSHFFNLAEAEMERAKRYRRPLSLVLLDIDDFKIVNDEHGHIVGDQALSFLGEVCRRQIRKNDLFGRLGGDEFIILFPELPAISANAISQRILDVLSRTSAKKFAFALTLSIGISEIAAGIESVQDLVEMADRALYRAKRNGKNRIELEEMPNP